MICKKCGKETYWFGDTCKKCLPPLSEKRKKQIKDDEEERRLIAEEKKEERTIRKMEDRLLKKRMGEKQWKNQ